MLDRLFTAMLGTVVEAPDEWAKTAARIKAIAPHDPAAETLEHCARDLRERLEAASKANERLTPEQYATLPHVRVTAQTVRQWCRDRELPGAVLSERGWEIPRDAVRKAKTPAVRAPRRRHRSTAETSPR